MSVTDIAAARWAKTDHKPQNHSPREALVQALALIDSGELDCDHVIICYAQERDGIGASGWLQAGSIIGYGQIGLLNCIANDMRR